MVERFRLRIYNKLPMYIHQVIQFVTFLSSNVGGHKQPLKGSSAELSGIYIYISKPSICYKTSIGIWSSTTIFQNQSKHWCTVGAYEFTTLPEEKETPSVFLWIAAWQKHRLTERVGRCRRSPCKKRVTSCWWMKSQAIHRSDAMYSKPGP